MTIRSLTAALILAVSMPAGPCPAQPASQASTAKVDEYVLLRRIWAYRSARAAAALGLAQQVEALGVGPAGTLGGLLARSVRAERALVVYLLGAPQAGPPRQRDDGGCTLSLEVTREALAAALERIRQRYDDAGVLKGLDFAAIVGAGREVFRHQATGRAHPALWSEGWIARRPGAEYFDRAAPSVRAFWEGHVQVEGRLEAEARARRDATRRLTEKVAAVAIKQGVPLGRYLRSNGGPEPSQLLRAARERALRYYADLPVVEVEMEVSLRTVYACLKGWLHVHRPDSGDIPLLEERIVAARGAAVRQVGRGWPERRQLKADGERLWRAVERLEPVPEWAGQALRRSSCTAPSSTTRRPSGAARSIRRSRGIRFPGR